MLARPAYRNVLQAKCRVISCSCAPRSAAIRRSSSTVATTSSWLDDNEVKPNSRLFKVKHPQSGVVVAHVHALDEVETSAAIRRSQAAFKSWRLRPSSERRDILLKAASLLQERKDAFRELYRRDTSVSDTVLDIDFSIALAGLKEAATAAMASMGEVPATQDGSLALITREPYGVVLSIAPFNFGLTLSLRTIAGPLSCGNTVIMKASPLIPSLHAALGPLFKEAGLPANVLQVLNFSPQDTPKRIEQCISHSDVRMVNFTGSTKVGKVIGSLCGQNVKPCLLELGGKAPAIVLPSAKMDIAANNILAGALLHSGQICMSTERVIVVESALKSFTAALARAADALVATRGNKGMELARPNASSELQVLVDDAVAKGARILHKSDDQSSASSFAPIVLTDVQPEARIYTEETFAPAFIIVPAKDVSEAIDLANENMAGLSASVWTEDLAEGLEVAKQLESGAVHINSMTVHDEPTLPHGGFKSSGFGRFNGKWAVESFTQTKTITTSRGQELPLGMLA